MQLVVLKNEDTVSPEPLPAAGKEAVLKTLVYFDIFHYPLTRTEIRKFLCLNIGEVTLAGWLAELEAEKKIFFSNGFYSVQDNPLLSVRRINGNQRAEKLLEKANRIGRFLYRFPFVRAVGISGSLSKNFADEKADIDFFIITKANRLWMARTLMHLYKKLTYISGSQHYYCMNYYVDEQALLIEDRSIFSAIEIKTLLPVCGEKAISDFFESNQWTEDYLPACDFRKQSGKEPRKGWIKRAWEWLLNNKAGNKIENYLFRLTQKRWKRKAERGKQNEKGQPMDLLCGKHFALSNPGSLREKVLAAYEEKVAILRQVTDKNPVAISSVK